MTEDVPEGLVSFEFVPLTKAHDRAAFDCGVPSLNSYLQRSARQNQDRDIGRTCVALEPGQVRVWGYYTLSSASTEFEEYPENAGLPRYPIPAVLLARLAVDKQRHGQGLGRELLIHALGSLAVMPTVSALRSSSWKPLMKRHRRSTRNMGSGC